MLRFIHQARQAGYISCGRQLMAKFCRPKDSAEKDIAASGRELVDRESTGLSNRYSYYPEQLVSLINSEKFVAQILK